eukprot:TRINITY_DN3893_c0_g1_i4.p1 TRINITY_DN3893_c0_g1~~TRINITY_DN3893_c0_g1_i4.p1  ORF type:complete len:409 (-),score=58.11 TRINITY_DN3893_c0_g1_i4:167-1291(-)
MFRFKNYPKLFNNLEWANLKLISFKKDELAAGMLEFTHDPIHAPLTQLPKTKENNVYKNGPKVFKNILGYMGDRKYQAPNILASELLTLCLQQKELRDEVYCQLIKQLTNNPKQESIQKGWDLMTLCLATFPPGSEMENYLEMFLRTKSKPAEKFVNLFHETFYYGGRSQPPSESEMNQIITQGEVKRNEASLPRADAIKLAPPPPATRGGRTYGAPPRGPPPGSSAPSGPPKGAPPPEDVPEAPVETKAPTKGSPPTGPKPTGASPDPGRAAFASQLGATMGVRGGPPRGGPPRGGPAPTTAKKEPDFDQSIQWHYIDIENNQKGPSPAAILRQEWGGGKLDGTCIVWNETMTDWQEVDTIPTLKAYLAWTGQ